MDTVIQCMFILQPESTDLHSLIAASISVSLEAKCQGNKLGIF